VYLEIVIVRFLKAGRIRVLAVAGVLIALIAVADWAIGNRASLGLLYIVPMMLGATVLAPWQTMTLAAVCSFLRSCFDLPSPQLEVVLRFIFSWLAYTCAAVFVTALIRKRAVEEQLKTLVQSSPAAILTTDRAGFVLAANRAAHVLFHIPEEQGLDGRNIGQYVPLLAQALRVPSGQDGFRAAMQCQGRRENGEIFIANTWFSSYLTAEGIRLAAIIVDSSEEMRDREEQGLRQLMRVNQITAAAVSHEARNLCSAIAVVCANLKARHALAQDEDLASLTSLVQGLERIASWELRASTQESLEEIPLQEVLDQLRIVIEPNWHEIGGILVWRLPAGMPVVMADRHGLFQVFLNLAQNSHRAVEESAVKELRIDVTVAGCMACVRFQDTGRGIANPDRLFAPFQAAANGTGLGLYVSRALMRYGGDLRFEPQSTGASFCVEIPLANGGQA
jgi:signal transduction histidine kinase